MRLLTESRGNTKLHKSERDRLRIVSLSLSPADSAGGKTNCPSATESCKRACVGGPNVGLASVWASIMQARIRKTRWLQEDRKGFLRQLIVELDTEQRKANAEGTRLVARLNTFSDLPWESEEYGNIPQRFIDVTFYDYTKRHYRWKTVPPNYYLCHSWDETPKGQAGCIEALDNGRNVSVVFAQRGPYAGNGALRQRLPKRFEIGGRLREVHDGDTTDLRFLDPGPTRSGSGRIIGLRLKASSNAARAEAMASGFCIVID